MACAHDESGSLRFGRRESARVVVALLVSLLVHLGVWGSYYTGAKLGWWKELHPPAWLVHAVKKYELQAQLGHEQQPDPTIFVDVSHADSEAPARTRYYSDKNSRAANPDAANGNAPKINGSQTDMPKTADAPKLVKAVEETPKAPTPDTKAATPGSSKAPSPDTPKETPKADNTPKFAKLEPSMPPPSPMSADQTESPTTPGDLNPRPKANAPPPAERPRTLKQALAQRDQLPGRQMQQEGGVARRALWPSLDVKSTAFGDYDRDLISAVQQRWNDLLDNHRYAQDRDGKVMLRFKLKPDGTVIEMQTIENNVGEVLGYLCQESIEEAAPFAKWPSDMAREIGTNYRDITFTFYYY